MKNNIEKKQPVTPDLSTKLELINQYVFEIHEKIHLIDKRLNNADYPYPVDLNSIKYNGYKMQDTIDNVSKAVETNHKEQLNYIKEELRLSPFCVFFVFVCGVLLTSFSCVLITKLFS